MLVDDVVYEEVDAVAAVQSGEVYGSTLGTWRADGVLSGWHTDEATGESSARERARKVLMNSLRVPARPGDRRERARKREGVPESVWRDLRADLRGDVLVKRGDAVELVSDPWATGRRSSRTSLLSTLF